MSNDDARWHLVVVNTHFNRHRRAEKLHKASNEVEGEKKAAAKEEEEEEKTRNKHNREKILYRSNNIMKKKKQEKKDILRRLFYSYVNS